MPRPCNALGQSLCSIRAIVPERLLRARPRAARSSPETCWEASARPQRVSRSPPLPIVMLSSIKSPRTPTAATPAGFAASRCCARVGARKHLRERSHICLVRRNPMETPPMRRRVRLRIARMLWPSPTPTYQNSYSLSVMEVFVAEERPRERSMESIHI